jgi:hypothetical protein
MPKKKKKKVTKRKQFRKGVLVSLKKNMKQRMAKGLSNERPSKRQRVSSLNTSPKTFKTYSKREEESRFALSLEEYWRDSSPTDEVVFENSIKMKMLSKKGKQNLISMLGSKGSFEFRGDLRSSVEKRYIPFHPIYKYASGYWSTSLMFNITMVRPNKGKPSALYHENDHCERWWTMYQENPREAQNEAPGGDDRMELYKSYIANYLQSSGAPVAYHMLNQDFGGGPVMPASHNLNMSIKLFENTLKSLKGRILCNGNFDAREKNISNPDKPIITGELAMVVSCIRPAGWEGRDAGAAFSYNQVYEYLDLPLNHNTSSVERIFGIQGAITAVVRHAVTFGVRRWSEKLKMYKFVPMSPSKLDTIWKGFIDFINYSSADGRGLKKLGFSNPRQKRGNIYLFESEIKQEYLSGKTSNNFI